MQGKVDEGIRFLHSREGDWGSGNLFTVHNWWHLALFLLEAGRRDDVLAIYDAQVHNEASARVPLELLDASALLWRLKLDGVDTEGRFASLADAWTTKTRTSRGTSSTTCTPSSRCAAPAASMTPARSSKTSRVSLRESCAPPSNVMMTAEVGLPASRAAIAFTEGRYADVVAELLPIRTRFNVFGGSHAQRDVLQRTLTDAAIRSGQVELARALVSERLSERDTSIYGLRRQASVLRLAGAVDTAAATERRADVQQAVFGAAAERGRSPR